MSSSEQLTLGAKLCAILIRHLRYLPLCLSLVGAHSENTDSTIPTLVVFVLLFPVTTYHLLSLSLFSLWKPYLLSLRFAAYEPDEHIRAGKGKSEEITQLCTVYTRTTETRGATRSIDEHRESSV